MTDDVLLTDAHHGMATNYATAAAGAIILDWEAGIVAAKSD